MTSPIPRQRLHGVVLTTWPRIDWRTRRCWPEPPHWVQVTGLVPGRAPDPGRVAQATTPRNVIGRSAPNTASSKRRSRVTSTSSPRRVVLAVGAPNPPPAKKALNRSPNPAVKTSPGPGWPRRSPSGPNMS